MISRLRFLIVFLTLEFCFVAVQSQHKDSRFLSFVTAASNIKMYWKNDSAQMFGSIQRLKESLESNNQELRFAMNGGMYTKDRLPQGLFVENKVTLTPIDTLSGTGNFYLMPNGVFYLTSDNQGIVCQTKDYVDHGQVEFATQSGPMLLIDGEFHPAFRKGSSNLNIRNGVGILPDNKVVFAMSKEAVNFYDFVEFFKNLGCRNALYLDGFVSRMYLPEENWKQTDGDFGVIIGVPK